MRQVSRLVGIAATVTILVALMAGSGKGAVRSQAWQPNGDGHAPSVNGYALPGRVLGHRDQPVPVARVSALPVSGDPALTGPGGEFTLYLNEGGNYSLLAWQPNFGPLPPMKDVLVPEPGSPPTLFLPPAGDRIADGGLEAGDLSAWHLSGQTLPALVAGSHTGDWAVRLGGVTSVLAQDVDPPGSAAAQTLSLLYRSETLDPADDRVAVTLSDGVLTATHTLPLTESGWVHAWWDVPQGMGPALTLRVEWRLGPGAGPGGVVLDELSLGTAIRGAVPAYLPLATRSRPAP
jgi:hypothetical protein